MRSFGRDGILNTDDNLYLEFSAPFSIGRASVMAENVSAIVRHRERIIPYLAPGAASAARAAQLKRWEDMDLPIGMMDEALVLYLGGGQSMPRFQQVMTELKNRYPRFAPARFLREAYLESGPAAPTLLRRAVFALLADGGARTMIEISAVLVPVTRERVSVMFVDNAARKIYGQRYFSGPGLDEQTHRFAAGVMSDIEAAYRQEARKALTEGKTVPSQELTLQRIRQIIDKQVQEPSMLQEKAD
jgi:spermidine synthase